MSTHGKTPYELRFSLIQEASAFLREAYQDTVARATAVGAFGHHHPIPFPTTEEVLKLAEQYKSFVEER